MYTEEELTVKVGDKPVSKLNGHLAVRQGVTKTQLENLKTLHAELHQKFSELKEKDELTKEEAVEYFNEIRDIEFDMQDNWNFEKNEDMHSNWFKDPNCTCPYLDNVDSLGSELNYYSGDCKIHKHMF